MGVLPFFLILLICFHTLSPKCLGQYTDLFLQNLHKMNLLFILMLQGVNKVYYFSKNEEFSIRVQVLPFTYINATSKLNAEEMDFVLQYCDAVVARY